MAAGKQRCREGSGRVTSELGTSPGWVQGHEHHCRMSPEVRVVLGTGSLLDAQAALATTVKSQLSPHLIPSKTAADGKHRKAAALDLDSSLPLPSHSPSPRGITCAKGLKAPPEQGRQKIKPVSTGV